MRRRRGQQSSDQKYEFEQTPSGDGSSSRKKRTELTTGGANASGGKSGSSSKSSQESTFVSIWNDSDLLSVQLNYDDIEDIKTIGSGAYGVVWLVKYRNSQVLASKRLKPGETDRQRTQAFIAEIKLVAKFDHPHIVKFVGAAWTMESDIQALFEYLEYGDLRTYLMDAYTPREWTREKLQIAIGIVEALVYVHSFTPPLVHRDLKSRNVLLSEELEAKLTDFGVSRFSSEDNTMTTGVGTGKWLAPEVISGKSDYDQSADIYAFGVVLSEIDTHAVPYEELRGTSGNQLAEVAILQLVAKGELVPSFSETCPENIKELAARCLSFEPTARPSAVEIAYILRTIQRNMHFSL
uniref:Protein kinase domain-containing protein n=1 Tax=Globisporangium ultimum (strain ATCC 200006 / CBS 805.95 / DAOM BR144) TaxID=431595 RepID=K3X7M7_GLOUD